MRTVFKKEEEEGSVEERVEEGEEGWPAEEEERKNRKGIDEESHSEPVWPSGKALGW